MPALAVAQACRAEHPDWPVLLVGRAGGPEERMVPAAGFELATIPIRGLDRDAVLKNLALPVLIPAAFWRGLRVLDAFGPDVVLGMGGYAMAPAVWAARRRRVPYVLHEKDVRPGLATRMFAAGAATVCFTLPGTESRLPAGVRTVLTGVPLRSGFARRRPAVPPRVLLVTGGSQGARRLNQAVWSALPDLLDRFERVIHLAGRQGGERAAEIAAREPRYRGIAFTDQMADLLAEADLVVSRAGVSTIGEVTCCGLPALLVPGTFAGRHQELNADAVVGAGAGARLDDEACDGPGLLAALDQMLARPERLAAMAEASAALGRPDAADRVLGVLEGVAG